MKIIYQGKETETAATNVAGFLAERQIDCSKAIVEYDGEVYAPGSDLAALTIKCGASLDVFKMMAGG